MWSVAVLTSEYLVEGMLDSDSISYLWALETGPKSQPSMNPIVLLDARLQSVGALKLPAASASHQIALNDLACLATIPRDQSSTDFVTKNSKCVTRGPVEVLVGPYAIRGTIWSPKSADKGVEFVTTYSSFVLQDAHIECLTPGSKLPSLDVPLMVVFTNFLHSAAVAPSESTVG